MPIKKGTCGIYAIKTPSGSTYVGSSICIERRFLEHKSQLRRGCHHNSRLQKAYNKYQDRLVFSILTVCGENNLVEMEQRFIKEHKAKLNIAQDVNNVWTNPEVRAKLEAIYTSHTYRAKRSILSNRPAKNWKEVECSDGSIYRNMTEAGRAYGISATRVKEMIRTGYPGSKTTVKFKFKGDDWPPNLSHGERLKQARANNGKNKMSEDSKLKMSIAAKGRKPTQNAIDAAVKASSIPVKGISITTGEEVVYPSSMSAGRVHGNGNTRGAAAQINKCMRGVKKTAYGYKWEYA